MSPEGLKTEKSKETEIQIMENLKSIYMNSLNVQGIDESDIE
jgi:hypothetical protein